VIAIETVSETPLSWPFRWRSAGGQMRTPAEMETRHLFYTIRMIWNHSMPEDALLRPFQAYTFGTPYTEDYMRRAIKALFPVLMGRADIEPKFRAQIEFMRLYLAKQQVVLGPPVKDTRPPPPPVPPSRYTPEERANLLIASGYRATSNKYRMVSRIDREDWIDYMAGQHAPWDPKGEGLRWASRRNMGDQYRRVYSRDKIELTCPQTFQLVRRESSHGWGHLDEFLPQLIDPETINQ
jgi:hypothetical protein